MVQPTSHDHGLKLLAKTAVSGAKLDSESSLQNEDLFHAEPLEEEILMSNIVQVGFTHQASYVFIALGFVISAFIVNLYHQNGFVTQKQMISHQQKSRYKKDDGFVQVD